MNRIYLCKSIIVIYMFSVSCVGLSHSEYSALESDGLMTITLVLTGGSQLVPVDVVIITSITNEVLPSATGIYMWLTTS